MNWKPYREGKIIAQHPSGFFIIKPVDDTSKPIFCPLCESVMSSRYDEESYDNFGCCDKCANSWVYPNRERWDSGWRPSLEEARNKSSIR